MLVLALDTSLSRTAVAVTDGRRVHAVRIEEMDRGHSERLFSLVREALAEAGVALQDVERFAVTVGPGSFTGVRIGIAAARGFALATGRPVVGVGTLQALAASLPERAPGPVLAAIDARRGEIYAALFSATGEVLVEPFAADAETVLDKAGDAPAVIVGNGAPILAHQAAITGRRVPPLEPLAGPDPAAIARLGASGDPARHPPAPLYIRPPDAKPPSPLVGLFAGTRA